MDDPNLSLLRHKFLIDTNTGLRECESNIINPQYESFDQFRMHFERNMNHYTCHESWNNERLTGHCDDCQLTHNSCICIPCFIKGGHINHHSHISHDPGGGNCDCGDASFWKPEGNCVCHHGPEKHPDLTQLQPEMRQKLIISLAAAFEKANLCMKDDQKDFSKIIEWLFQFTSLGDAVRRCLSIAIIDYNDILSFIKNQKSLTKKLSDSVLELFGGIINDQYFVKGFSKSVYMEFNNLVTETFQYSMNPRTSTNTPPLIGINQFLQFSYHVFSDGVLDYHIRHNNFNWCDLFNNFIKTMVDFFEKCGYSEILKKNQIFYICWQLEGILKVVQSIEGRPQLKEFTQSFANYIFQIEGRNKVSRAKKPKHDDMHQEIYSYNLLQSEFARYIPYLGKQPHIYDIIFQKLMEFIRHDLIDNDFDSPNTKIPLFERSVLDFNTKSSISLTLHSLTMESLRSSEESINDIVEKMSSKFNISKSHICQYVALLPLRWYAIHVLSLLEVFPCNSNIFNFVAQKYIDDYNIESYFMNHFSLIQLMLGTTDKKNEFVDMMANVFGMFNQDFTNFYSKSESSFYYVISSLILDRVCLNKDSQKVDLIRILVQLLFGQTTTDDLKNSTIKQDLNENDLIKKIEEYSSRISTKEGNIWSLIDDSEISMVHPYVHFSILQRAFIVLVKKYPNLPVPFPEYLDPPFGIDLKPVFNTPVLFAIVYQTMFHTKTSFASTSQIGLHYALNIFICMATNFDANRESKAQNINANDLKSLTKHMPDNFNDFIVANISFKFQKYSNIIKLIESIGPIGINTLIRSNIGYNAPERTENESNKLKQRIKVLKENVTAQYEVKKQKFENELKLLVHSDLCSCCHLENPDDVLLYPCCHFKSILPDLVQKKIDGVINPIASTTIGFHICDHIIHHHCGERLTLKKCSVCKKFRNCFLPVFPNYEFGDISCGISRASMEFVTSLFNNIDFQQMVRAYVGHINLLEIRSRLRPECLDDNCMKLLTKNLFLSFYHLHAYKSSSMIEDPDENEELVQKLLIDPDPINNSMNIIIGITKRLKGARLFQFLRRSLLIQYLSLGIPIKTSDMFIDWDYELDIEVLKQKYVIDIDLMGKEFPYFKPAPLADNFLENCLEPYNYDIINYDRCYFVCLITGNVVYTQEKAGKVEGVITMNSHLLNYCGSGSSIYFSLNGNYATSIFFASKEFALLYPMVGPYIDEYGDADIGLNRGQPLKLSHEKLNDIIDKFLSGDWIDIVT